MPRAKQHQLAAQRARGRAREERRRARRRLRRELRAVAQGHAELYLATLTAGRAKFKALNQDGIDASEDREYHLLAAGVTGRGQRKAREEYRHREAPETFVPNTLSPEGKQLPRVNPERRRARREGRKRRG